MIYLHHAEKKTWHDAKLVGILLNLFVRFIRLVNNSKLNVSNSKHAMAQRVCLE